MVLKVLSATREDIGDILHLRAQAEDWLQERGIDQWRKGEVTMNEVIAQVDLGEWHIARDSEILCGALRLLWSDWSMWQERNAFAAYVHGLVIDRRCAGTGLGSQLLAWAEEQGRNAHAPALRLDCVEGNAHLRHYYTSYGFEEIGLRKFDDGCLPSVLMEKRL